MTEDGLALGAGVSRSKPDSGSWVTLGVMVDVWPCPVSAAVAGRDAHFGGGFPVLGKPGERRLVTAQWAAREGNRRPRIQGRWVIRESSRLGKCRQGPCTAGPKSFSRSGPSSGFAFLPYSSWAL